MKNKGLIISTLVFFLIVNTNYFWEGELGLYAFPAFILLVIIFFVLVFMLFLQLISAIKEKFKNKKRLLTIGLLTVVLILTFLRPNGIVNFENLQGNDLLVAQREGVANCMTTFKLKENNRFSEINVCFGVTKISGEYIIKNDTIFFENIEYGRHENEFYEFAVIKPSKINPDKFDLVRFKNKNDTIGHELGILKNIEPLTNTL